MEIYRINLGNPRYFETLTGIIKDSATALIPFEEDDACPAAPKINIVNPVNLSIAFDFSTHGFTKYGQDIANDVFITYNRTMTSGVSTDEEFANLKTSVSNCASIVQWMIELIKDYSMGTAFAYSLNKAVLDLMGLFAIKLSHHIANVANEEEHPTSLVALLSEMSKPEIRLFINVIGDGVNYLIIEGVHETELYANLKEKQPTNPLWDIFNKAIEYNK